jgi:hypothetical protein
MKLDLRYPIGLLFSVFGVILTLYGIFGDKTIYQRSLGMDVNLWWGLICLGFGLAMLSYAVRGSGKGST